jgi:glucose-6-phosphate isomerase
MARWEDPDFKVRMRIALDFNRARAARVGPKRGLSPDALEGIAPRVSTVVKDLLSLRSRSGLEFADLPCREKAIGASEELAARIREGFDTLVVLGSGGGSLGAQALVDALAPRHQAVSPRERSGGPRVLFVEEPDPDTLASLLDTLDVQRTAFCVAAGSAESVETLALFWILRDRLRASLGHSGYASRVVGIATQDAGTLSRVASQDGFSMLEISESTPGTFAVLTPMGLLPACVAGIDVREVMAGAAAMEQRCRDAELWENPAAALAAFAYLMDTQLGCSVLAFVPFADGLRRFASWFVRLWAQGLARRVDLEGKVVNSGATPLAVHGWCDKDSLHQLFAEGPDDKFVVFMRVRSFEQDVSLPSLEGHEEGGYLGGRQLSSLMEAGCLASAITLADEGRPSCMLDLPALNPHTLGGAFMLAELACVVAAGLYRVDPFQQPGLRSARSLAQALLGRPGFGGLAARAATEDEGEEKYRF